MKLLKSLCKRLRSSESSPTTVDLVSCRDADEHMESFLELLPHSKIDKVLIRTDFLKRMSEDNAQQFLSTLGDIPHLTSLTIQCSSRFHIDFIPAAGLLSLRKAVHLQSLVLEDMQVNGSNKAFIVSLATALRNHPSITNITMINFFANDWANTEPDILDSLLYSLATIPNLVSLELSGCGSHALSGQDVPLVSPEALSTFMETAASSTLTTLQLSFLELDDDHFEAVASKLNCPTSLQTIVLDYHRLGSRGFHHMMQAMEQNSWIKSLSLRSLRDIGVDGYEEAMKMLQRNYTIKSLSVTASPTQQAQIDLYLRMNGAGRGLLREPKADMDVWLNVLANNSEDVDVVRHLLLEIPELCSWSINAEAT